MPNSIQRFFSVWRTTVVRDREIIDADVVPSEVDSLAFNDALNDWPGIHYWDDRERGKLVLVRAVEEPGRERWWLHTILFLATFLTMWVAGAILAGIPVEISFPREATIPDVWDVLVEWFVRIGPGFQFSFALMAILFVHEMGHYVLARRYHIDASPPYFLPAPWGWNFIGTFGAFIRIRSPIVDRRQLLDVGAAGPWAGLFVSLGFLIFGLTRSDQFVGTGATEQLILVGDIRFFVGDSLMMVAARELFTQGGTVLLHPLAFAGWLGLFVTTLNLLPLGQLDGGHVLYAMVGDFQEKVGWAIWILLILLGFQFRPWWIWALLTIALGRGKLSHPSVLDRFRSIPRSRVAYGWATVLLFVVTFTPFPFPLVN